MQSDSMLSNLSRTTRCLKHLNEAFKHCKAIAATGEGVDLLSASQIAGVVLADPHSHEPLLSDQGVVTATTGAQINSSAKEFIQAIAQHRHWTRAKQEMIPA